MVIESRSSPEGGELDVTMDDDRLVLDMRSEELSTLRAMLNSYLGLLSAAKKAHDI